jgi:tetratricopeptide (TPR) repeat protein
MSQTCPACGAEAPGRFCNQCGVAVDAACRECGNPLPRGARFCNQCGAAATPAPQAAARRASPLPWVVAGAAVVALAAVLLFRRGGEPGAAAAAGQDPAAPAAAVTGTGAPGGAAAVDLSSMTPREAADRLFNRVMVAVSEGDSAQARQFLPMAVQAYGMAAPLDADGHYHLAALRLVGGDFPAARAEADSILAGTPDHLFGLFTAAQAEDGRGNADAALALYRRFLDRYDAEVAAARKEYGEHTQALPGMKAEAQRRVGSTAGRGA